MSISLSRHEPLVENTSSRHLPWVGGVVFLGGYLASRWLNGLLDKSSLPAPNAPDSAVVTYFAAEVDAVAANAACNLVSAMGLLAFLVGVGRLVPWDRFRAVAATLAMTGLLVSDALSWTLVFVVGDVSPGTVTALHDAGIHAGGVVSIGALGLLVASFVWGPAASQFDSATRLFGRIVAVIAILGIASLVFEPAAYLMLPGRALCMAWTIAAGVNLLVRRTGQALD